MSVEMHLWRVSLNRIEDMMKHGCAYVLDDPHQDTGARNWILLDEMILAFMNDETPTHQVLFDAVMGGTAFADSQLRGDWPRYLTPAEVEKMAADLGAVSATEIRDRLKVVIEKWGLTDASVYAHLDPAIKEKMGLKDASPFDHLNQRFQEIVQYYQVAADNQQAMLLLLY